MPKAYFLKVSKNTTWNNLLTANRQMPRKCVPLYYEIIVDISISPLDFSLLERHIGTPNPSYLPYTNRSITDENGILHCITIKSESDDRKIILYTAGRTFPLYAAVGV